MNLPGIFQQIGNITSDVKSINSIQGFFDTFLSRISQLEISWTLTVISMILLLVKTFIICAYFKGPEWEIYCFSLFVAMISIRMTNHKYVIYLLLIIISFLFHFSLYSEKEYGIIMCLRMTLLYLMIPITLYIILNLSLIIYDCYELESWIWKNIITPVYNTLKAFITKIHNVIDSIEKSSVAMTAINVTANAIHIGVKAISDVVTIISDIVRDVKNFFSI